MLNESLRIGISTRIVSAPDYNENRDALSHDWPPFLEKIDIIPIFIPNTLGNVKTYLKNLKIDGLILSGGDNIGDFVLRDKTEREILEFSIESKIPIFGVCRGMQMINDFFGGTIIKTQNENHVGKTHPIGLTKPEFSSFLNNKEIIVNSFHNNIIKKENLGTGLEPFALYSKDDTVEGFVHKDYPIIGVMWHPERDPNLNNQSLIKKLFEEKIFWNK